ncbi:MAG: DNA translocase FtsK 4TM domain-containing protein [Myxococcales bacterium]|nr:DNA translocase FtsK 4TM domain-containing protein [Myxococcales bacterium]
MPAPPRSAAEKPAARSSPSATNQKIGANSPAVDAAPAAAPEGKRHEVVGLVTLAFAALSGLALASYDARGGRDWVGPAGAAVAEGLVAVLGTASVLVPIALLVQSVQFFRRTVQPVRPLRVLGTAAIVVTIATALHLALGERPLLGHLAAGGLLGVSTGETLRAILGTAGAHLVVLTALLVALVVRTRLSVVAFAKGAGRAGAKTGHLAKEGVVTVARAWHKARVEDDASDDLANSPRIVSAEDRVEHALSGVLDTHDEGLASLDAAADEGDAPVEHSPARAPIAPADASPSALFAEAHEIEPSPRVRAAVPAVLALDDAFASPSPEVAAPVELSVKKRPTRKRPTADAPAADPSHATAASPAAPAIENNTPPLASLPPIVIAPSMQAATPPPAIAATDPARLAERESALLMDLPASESPAKDGEPDVSSGEAPSPKRRSARRATRAVVVEGDPLPPAAVAPIDASPATPPPLPRVAPSPTPRSPVAAKPTQAQATPPATQPPKSVPPPAVKAEEPARAPLDPLPIVSHEEEIAAALETPPEPTTPQPRTAMLAPADYTFPATGLLTAAPRDGITVDEGALRAQAERLVKTLKDYQIEGEIAEIHPGPVVTTFEFVPTAGTKLARIAARSDDIAMSLAVNKVRIVAPIPGKGRVGFEIPNASRKTVFFRELVETEAFNKLGGALPVALGKDVVGAPFFSDLASMPHLIVAGATGQGKSVGLNVMLCSMLYKRTPEDVRMLMIDPKMVELAVYDGIPHMLLPVVTDMKKAALALRWVVDEMERRYTLFAQTGSRNIVSYNERVAKSLETGVPLKGLAGPVRTKKTGTTTDVSKSPDAAPDSAPADPKRLPYIVVVVDEFADLMMVAGKEVEAAVARLAQKARAAGIHVILATQRPSVDVITGMIKANFPSRVGFKVTSKVDSRTILDQQGAENLLGKGDMLILPPGSSDLRRVHCAFVSEDEVQAITDHWRNQGTPTYDDEILRPREEEEENAGDEPEIKVPAEKYEKAVALVLSSRRCSVSWIQRQLAIGYNVAARIVERMERDGIVSAPRGPGKDREVLG